MKYHYSLFAVQLPDGYKKIINLDAIAHISIEPSQIEKYLTYWVFLIDGESIMLPEAEGHRLERSWSIFLTAKFAAHHAPAFMPNGVVAGTLVKDAMAIDYALKDAAQHVHEVTP